MSILICKTFGQYTHGRADLAMATTDPVGLSPGPRTPRLIQTTTFSVSSHAMFASLAKRYGSGVVRVNLPRKLSGAPDRGPLTGRGLKQCDAADVGARYCEGPARKPWQYRNGEWTRW